MKNPIITALQIGLMIICVLLSVCLAFFFLGLYLFKTGQAVPLGPIETTLACLLFAINGDVVAGISEAAVMLWIGAFAIGSLDMIRAVPLREDLRALWAVPAIRLAFLATVLVGATCAIASNALDPGNSLWILSAVCITPALSLCVSIVVGYTLETMRKIVGVPYRAQAPRR